MPFCLPISTELKERHEEHSVGTCFFVGGRSRAIWMVTCAHLATNDTGFSDFSRWSPLFTLHFPSGGTASISVVSPSGYPLFRPVRTREGTMVDLVVLSVEGILTMLPNDLTVFDLAEPHVAPGSGSAIASYGHPHLGDMWPGPLHEIQGAYYRRLADGAHEAHIGMIKGHSGGPVLTSRGELIGMGIGQNEDVDRIIPLDIIELAAT